jgi:hypothetical protein
MTLDTSSNNSSHTDHPLKKDRLIQLNTSQLSHVPAVVPLFSEIPSPYKRKRCVSSSPPSRTPVIQHAENSRSLPSRVVFQRPRILQAQSEEKNRHNELCNCRYTDVASSRDFSMSFVLCHRIVSSAVGVPTKKD